MCEEECATKSCTDPKASSLGTYCSGEILVNVYGNILLYLHLMANLLHFDQYSLTLLSALLYVRGGMCNKVLHRS